LVLAFGEDLGEAIKDRKINQFISYENPKFKIDKKFMIQRPQTLMLGLILILMLAALFLPNWEKISTDGTITAVQTAFDLKMTTTVAGSEPKVDVLPRYHLAACIALVAGLAGYSISQFKNRKRQMLVGFGISLSLALTLVAMMMGIKEGESLFDVARQGWNFKPGFYALFLALFANIVSNRLIRKDENLVRSMDRIR
jgi:hypothetical protein